MAENKKKLFTESFEKVVNTFYDTAEAANTITESTIDAEMIGTFTRDSTKEFNGSVPLNELTEDDEPATVGVDRTGEHQMTIQLSPGGSVTLVELPQSPPESSTPEEFHQVFRIPRIPLQGENTTDGLNANSNEDTYNEVYLRTSNPFHIIAFEWTLENFSRYVDQVKTPTFSASNCEKTWQAFIVKSKNPEENTEFIELYMEAVSEFQEPVHAHLSLGAYNNVGDSYEESLTIAKFTKDQRVHQCLITNGPYVGNTVGAGQNRRRNVGIYDDEIIIKGSIQLTGCCVQTQWLSEPKLKSR